MDGHFLETPIGQSLPVAAGPARRLVRRLLRRADLGVLPYDQYLHRFPAYLQQLTMESNGKHVTARRRRRGLPDRRDLLGRARHQRPALLLPADPPGDKLIPCDFIGFAHPNPLGDHHDLLMANFFAQTEALAFGKTPEQVREEGTPEASSRTGCSRATGPRT